MEISNFLSKYHLSGSDSGSKSKIYERVHYRKIKAEPVSIQS